MGCGCWLVITYQHPYHLYTLFLPTSLVMVESTKSSGSLWSTQHRGFKILNLSSPESRDFQARQQNHGQTRRKLQKKKHQKVGWDVDLVMRWHHHHHHHLEVQRRAMWKARVCCLINKVINDRMHICTRPLHNLPNLHIPGWKICQTSSF